MKEYMCKMRCWANVLAIAGSPYSDNLLVASVLSGLDAENMPNLVPIEANPTTTWQELQDRLLSYDNKLERMNTLSGVHKSTNLANIAVGAPPPSVNFATRAEVRRFKSHGSFRGGNRGNRGKG
jgi:hypothetical protein